MKKYIVFFIILFIAGNINAQLKIAYLGGLNVGTARADYSNGLQTTGFVPGLGLGVMADIPFDGILHFTPYIKLNQKGFIIKPNTGNNIKEKYSIPYLDLIPALTAFFKSGENKIALGIGPDFALTDFGKIKSTDINNVTTTQNLKFGKNDWGPIDIGLNATIGYHMKKTFVELTYYYGFVGINNNEFYDNRNIRNRAISINFGYYFKQIKQISTF